MVALRAGSRTPCPPRHSWQPVTMTAHRGCEAEKKTLWRSWSKGLCVVTWGFADVTVSSAHINAQQCSFD